MIFNIDDLELMLVALKSQREKDYERLKDAERLERQAQTRRYTGLVNRNDKLKEEFENQIKAIRGAKFEEHKKSKKWNRGVMSNSRLIK